MKICFVTEGTVDEFWETGAADAGSPDLLAFGFHGLRSLSYKKELDGETEYFHDVAILSKELGCAVVSGCDTETYGTYRRSAVIADKGRILGVSDMAHAIDDTVYQSGGGFRVYDTSAGKIGLMIGEDLYFPETWRVLALCDADLILSIFPAVTDSLPEVMLRAAAFTNGVAAAMCAEGCCQVADIRGEIAFRSRERIAAAPVSLEKDYRLISCRRRGIYREFRASY